MVSQADIRTADIKKAVSAFEQERDKLLDQVQYIKGNSDRIEWVIKVLNGQISQIEQEEAHKAKLIEQQEAALKAAREKGNVGAHPSERAGDLAERRKQAQAEQPAQPQQVSQPTEAPKAEVEAPKKKGKK